jgi:hypothetical protein
VAAQQSSSRGGKGCARLLWLAVVGSLYCWCTAVKPGVPLAEAVGDQAGVAQGLDEKGGRSSSLQGKLHSGSTRKGPKWLRETQTSRNFALSAGVLGRK